jgi:ABC-type proline/glycine betaine transport system ATPase subunit
MFEGEEMRDTIDMAREAGLIVNSPYLMPHDHVLQGIKAFEALVRADEREKAKHNEEVLMNALWKACGDDGQLVEATIESQGELK